MQISKGIKSPLSSLIYLSPFAHYLLHNRLEDYARAQLRNSLASDLPMLRFFAHFSEEEKFKITYESVKEFLQFLANNQFQEQIDTGIQRWKENGLIFLNQEDIVAEDLIVFTHVRRQSFLQFIPDYTSNVSEALELVKEIDIFLTESEIASTSVYVSLLRDRLEEVQKIAGLGSFFWDLKGSASTGSRELQKIIGIDFGDTETFMKNVHPDDLYKVKEALEDSFKTGAFECEYRYILNGVEKYLWSRGVLQIKDGQALSMRGTVMDLSEKQRLLARLRRSEHMYRQAEVLSNMGNWIWEIESGKIEWTDHLYDIYELEHQSPITLSKFMEMVHPADRQKVAKGTEELLQQKEIDSTFRIITAKGKEKILNSLAQVIPDENGKPNLVLGTERDITESQAIIDKLKESEGLYKQAQSLAKMGNFTWNIKSGHVEWSEEVFRIYDVEPGTPVNFTSAFAPILPQYQGEVQKAIELSLEHKKGQSVQYAIRLSDDSIRYLNLETDVIINENGEVEKILGTAQDITERETLLRQLQESQELYKQAQSLVSLGSWSYDIINEKAVWSDELYAIYDMKPREFMTYQEWMDYIHPDEKEEVIEYFNECIRTKSDYDKIHRIITEKGTEKVLHRRAKIFCDENGNPVRANGTTQDITRIHSVQKELEENKNFIQKIADATPSIIASYNINTGKYTFVSEGIEKLLGYAKEDILKTGIEFFTEIIHPDDISSLLRQNMEALEEANANPDLNNLVIESTYRMRHRSGDYRWFHTYGTIFDRNAEGKVEHVLNISLDITEQKEATRKIAEQEHFIEQIADASPTILYLYDVENQNIAYINREIFFVLGYLPDEIVEAGPDVTELLYHPDDYHLLPARMESPKNFQQVDSMMQYECRMKNKNGEWRWFLVREIVFKTDEKGNISQILGAALDIHRRKDMERTILQNTLQLEQSNASLEEFAYVASHDLKEPLRKISTFGDRLAASQAEMMTPEGQVYLKKIIEASHRMQAMISDLLSISMISGNRSFENYSLQKVFEETMQTLEYKVEQLDAEIVSDPLPEANIIPSQFRQLFQNLLSNSLKFVRPDAKPRITISYERKEKEELDNPQLSRSKYYHQLQFRDNGIGFENEFAGKIFAIFQRLHGRSEYEGSGIGLSICKKIVEHHGGIITATSELGAGATFTITFPE